jgi:S-DNA-T family DNA segregation ATPase FtsK/SpoIIIE
VDGSEGGEALGNMRRKKEIAERARGTVRRAALELLGLAVWGLSAYLLMSLLSHSDMDPSFNRSGSASVVRNWGGIVGAYVSDLVLQIFGVVGYGLIVFGAWAGWRLIRSGELSLTSLQLSGIGLGAVATCGIVHVLGRAFGGTPPLEKAGGIVGYILCSLLLGYLNPGGTWLFLLLLLCVSLILASRAGVLNLFRAPFGIVREPLRRVVEKLKPEARAASKAKGPPRIVRRKGPKIEEPEIIELPRKPPAKLKPVQDTLPFAGKGGYRFPHLALLDEPPPSEFRVDRETLRTNAILLERKLADFGVQGKVTEIHPGPIVTLYEFEPAPGVKISRIVSLQDDLAMALRALSIRIIAPIPGKAAVGVEIPNARRETVFLQEILASEAFQKATHKLTIALGKDTVGRPVVANLASMPHLLIAGATGSGKSVCLNAIITSILFRATPEEVKFLMVDPKRLELSVYRDIPHLLHPVVVEPRKAAVALGWAVREMERRYRWMERLGVRNIDRYNARMAKGGVPTTPWSSEEQEALPERLPYIVVVIDELSDLMMVASRDVEEAVLRLAQMARAAGIHLVVATQRPSVDVLTGTIKINLPVRIAFQVTSKFDSRTILDTQGAEHLLGAGDMLFLPPGTAGLQRIHGAYVSEGEVKRVVDFLKQQAAPRYDPTVLQPSSDSSEEEGDAFMDEKYEEAVALAKRLRQVSISSIQRHLRIGYNRAARIIERMEAEGIVGPADGSKPREVLVRSGDS